MKNRVLPVCGFLLVATALFCPAAVAQTVRFQTNFGAIDVTLQPDVAPITVANFLKYVNRGSYNNSFFHRSVPGFIIQGGGYQFNDGPQEPADPPIQNEFKISNTRGTLAMALLGGDPNSATTEWFFNLGNNSANLDNQNGGFTVFGLVASAAGLAVMDRIAAVPVYSQASPFDQIPLQNYKGGPLTLANVVLVSSITVVEATPTPSIADNGIISASNFGGFASAAPGSYLEIYGSDLAGTTRGWSASDFVNGRAPTSLDGVTVTINGRPAFVNFVSPTQVNVQVPGAVTTGGSVLVYVTYGGKPSAAVSLPMNDTAGGLLAPPAFNVNGKQYAAAVHQATGAFVSNGGIPGLPAAPAAPGETLTFYGIGFGPVTPGPVAGQIATGTNTLTATAQFQFGEAQARIQYAGLAPGLVGVYQFNVVVPADSPTGDVPLKVSVGGQPLAQTLFVPVQAASN